MPFLRKYNTLTVTGTTAIRIPIIKRGVVDFAVSADWTPAAGDVKIAIDGAASANVTNLPTAVAMGNGAYWEFILTAAELTCKSCIITVADSATKAVEDQAFIVETFGHASAMYAADLSLANLPANVVQFAGAAITSASGIPEVKVASIAADAVNASAVAADAVTEIQSGLATAADQTLIKAKTDQLTFTVANKVDSTAELDSAAIAAVADAVLTESILDHRNVANSLAKFIWQIRQANLTIDGTVSNAITPTTLTFASNVVATTSAYAHAVLLFTTGPLAGENSPIISYNSTNGVFLLEEALTAAPSNGDEFVVIAGSHVHSVADIQSGLASQSSVDTLVSRLTANAATAIQNLWHMITGTGASSKYTVAALENAPAGGGGGSATLEKQEEILTAIGEISTAQLAAITVESGVIGNFPDTLTIGDSYDTDTGWIKVLITDEADDPITGLGDLLFSEADVSFTAFRPNDSARVYGVCEFVDAGSETYVKLTLTSEETTKGLPEYTYEGRLKFVWDSTSASSDLVDSRQKTYKTTPFKFIANP